MSFAPSAARYSIFEHREKRFLLLEGPWMKEIAAVMVQYDVRHLRLMYASARYIQSIEFMRDLPFLERLELGAPFLKDVSPLYDLPNLTELSLSEVPRPVDLTRIPRLASLNLSWNERRYSSLLECTGLTSLGMDNYPGTDLQRFGKLKRLGNFGLGFSRIESLSGIEELSALRRLSIGPANRLAGLAGIERCTNLEDFDVHGADSLRDLGPLAHLIRLRSLGFAKCRNLDSLSPLRGLVNLESFCLLESTNVKDGDLSPLAGLPLARHISIRDRKHYSHRNTDFPKSWQTNIRPKLILKTTGEEPSAAQDPDARAG